MAKVVDIQPKDQQKHTAPTHGRIADLRRGMKKQILSMDGIAQTDKADTAADGGAKQLDSPVFNATPPVLEGQSFSWEAYPGHYYVKNPKWYAIIIVLFVALAGLAYFATHLAVSALTFFLLGFAIIILGSKKPERLPVTLDNEGISIGSTLYRFGQLASFWIFYDDPENLYIVFKRKGGINDLIVPLSTDIDPVYLREILLHYVKEEYDQESFSNILMRWLGL